MRHLALLGLVVAACSGDSPGNGSGIHTNVVANNELCNVRDYGAVGDGQHDDTAAINAALAACRNHIYVPASAACYLYTGTIEVSGAQFSATDLDAAFVIAGDGPQASCIENTASSSPTIVATSAEGGTIVGLKLIHTNPAPGGDGVRFTGGYSNYAAIKDAELSQNDIGLNLGNTVWGTVWNVRATSNLSHGISITGVDVVQWQLFDVISSQNGGDGVYVTGTGALGEINGLEALDNQGDGLAISTTGVIGDLRLKSSELQGNRGWGMHLDSGPPSTADIVSSRIDANGVGGIYASAVVDNVSISDSSISGNGGHGAVIYAASWQVLGGTISGNQGSGFYADAGRGRLGQVAAMSNANYGVFLDSGVTFARVAGVEALGNGLGTVYASSADTVVDPSLPAMTPFATAPAIPGPPALDLTGFCDARTYGARGDGVTDDTAAILAAFAQCNGRLYLPASASCYLFNGTLSASGTGFAVVGDQQMQSCLESTAPALPIIAAADTTGGVISDLHLAHGPPISGVGPTASQATTGGDGIRITGTTTNLTIENVYIEDNDVGINLGPATNGVLLDVISIDNASHGIAVSGSNLGWQMADVFVAGNGGDGLYVAGSGTLGTVNTIQAWSNAGHGIDVVGAGGAISATFANCYVGADGQSGLYADSNGGAVTVSSCQLEGGEAGGLYATASNARVDLFAIAANNNIGNAIELHAQSWQLSGGNVLHTQGNGIVAAEGAGVVFDVRVIDSSGYGVYVAPAVASATLQALDSDLNAAPLLCGANCISR